MEQRNHVLLECNSDRPKSRRSGLLLFCFFSMMFFGCTSSGSDPTKGSKEEVVEAPSENLMDKIKLVDYETGFIEYEDRNSATLLYMPIIIMKWKNISNAPLDDIVSMEALFIKDGEELSSGWDNFQGSSDKPLQPGLSRQIHLQSSVGYTSRFAIYDKNISCQIYVNDELMDTYEIEGRYLLSNRLSGDRVPKIKTETQDTDNSDEPPVADKSDSNPSSSSELLTVLGDNVNVRSSPDKQANVLFQMDKGDRCTFVEKGNIDQVKGDTEYWYKIEFEGRQGWVFGKFLGGL